MKHQLIPANVVDQHIQYIDAMLVDRGMNMAFA